RCREPTVFSGWFQHWRETKPILQEQGEKEHYQCSWRSSPSSCVPPLPQPHCCIFSEEGEIGSSERRGNVVETLLKERTKHLLKFRSAKLHERLRFDLADAFACDTERSPDLFQSHCLPLTDSEAETDDRFFARAQGAQGLGHLLGHLTTVHLTICRRGLAIGDKIPQKGLAVTDRILKRDDFLERLHGLSYPITGGFHDAGHLFKGGGSSQPLS